MTSNPSQSILEKHSLPILKIDSIESKNAQQNIETVVVTEESPKLSKSNQPSVFTVNSVATKVKLFNVSVKNADPLIKANPSILFTFSWAVFNHLKSKMTRRGVLDQLKNLPNINFTDPNHLQSNPRSLCRLQDHKRPSLLSVQQSTWIIKNSRRRVSCQISRLKLTNSHHLTNFSQVQALQLMQSHSSKMFQTWMSTNICNSQAWLQVKKVTVSIILF